MKKYSREAGLAKAGLLKFCEGICKGLGRTAEKLVTNVLYGIAAGNSCLLTEIARALDENITIKKTVDRLCAGLQHFSGHEVLRKNYLEAAQKHIDGSTLFLIDNSDIAKPCSTAMEALHHVRDGSTGEIVRGYMTLEIAALTHKTKTPLPIYERVYSAAEKEFVSQDEEILKGLRFLSKRFGHGGVRVMDRGYDANVYMQYLTKEGEGFIVRVKKNRTVKHNGKSVNVEQLANRYKGKCVLKCTMHGETIDCKVTEIPIQLPAFGAYPFNLCVIYGFGKEPMLLLTNYHSKEPRFCAAVAKMYLLRWKIEDNFRFKKQQYNFEDFRVRSLNAIRTLHQIVTMLSGYLAMLSQQSDSALFLILRQAAKAVPPAKTRRPKTLFHYELARGFAWLLCKTSANLGAHFIPIRCRPKSLQLSFFTRFAHASLLPA